MLNKIIRFSLQSRLVVLVITAIVVALGLVAVVQTEVDIFPDLNAPTVVVMTEAQGMAPEEVEKAVTYPIEIAVNGAPGLRRLRSSSTTGFSVVWVEFDWDTEIYRARQIVAERIAGVADQLPEMAGEPTMGPQSSILGEMLIISLQSDSMPLLQLRDLADRVISPRLLAISGVAQVSVLGGDAMEYQIKLSPEKMRIHGVSLADALDALASFNDNAGGGVMYQYGNEYIVKGDINTSDIAEIGDAVLMSDDRGIIKVSDIAEVTIGGKQPSLGAASVKAKPAVLVTVTKQSGVGTIGLTEDIEEALASLKPSLPAGVEIGTDIFRQSDFIENSIGNLQRSLFEGAIFVVIVLFFFLMNFRTTVISVIALPLSIIVSVLALHWMGFTINTMSLGGIAIAIGSLVDDAIVDVENVYKRLRQNHALPRQERKPVLEVVYHASAEVRMPILNSTLIIVASFMPLFFLSGMEGRLLIPLGVAFIIALAASTLVALTVTPVLCSLLLGSKKSMAKIDKEPWASRHLKAAYSHTLSWALAHGNALLWGAGVLFAGALLLVLTLGRSFLPPFNEGSFTINVSTLPGISLEESDRVGRMAEEIIMSVPEIKTVARKTGRSELDEHSLGVNVSEMEAPYELNGRTRGAVVRELRQKLGELPGVNVEIGQPISHRIDAMLSGTEAQIAIKLFGEDLNTLFALGNRIKDEIAAVPGVVDANIEQQMERPQLDIRPKRQIMAQYGVTMAQLRDVLETSMSGRTVSKVYVESYPYDLTVMFDDASRGDIEALRNVPIDTKLGKVPLSTVADIVSATGPNGINRENVKRRLVISANVDGRDLRGTVNDIQKRLQETVALPENYYLEYGGQFESEARATGTLALTSLGALVIIFMLLYHEFKSVKQSLIVLVNMPLAMIGGVVMLKITNAELNIPAIIGFISLLGIATRNGMLLISRYNALEAQGVDLAKRVAIGSSDRLLPIIMTALTSALALIPLAINGKMPGNEIQSPMAIVILGGLITSTALNAYVVPILYILSNKKNKK